MSIPIIQGYSSSEEEDQQNIPEHEPPTKKIKTFAGSFQNLPHVNQSTFNQSIKDESRKISKEAKKLAKELKKKKNRNKNKGSNDDPWSHQSCNNTEEEEEEEQQQQQQQLQPVIPSSAVDNEYLETPFEPSSEYVGLSPEFDYQGRTYMTIPKFIIPKLDSKSTTTTECFVPKRVIHTIEAHTKGINKLQFFPRSGHLLLSCGNDNLIKLWRIYPNSSPSSTSTSLNGEPFELLRVFKGHRMAVKDIKFSASGKTFLSCGYDKMILLWDTESGKVLKKIKVGSVPNVLLFKPKKSNKNKTNKGKQKEDKEKKEEDEDEEEDEFIVGLSNFTIEHYKFNSLDYKTPIQIYNHHQGGIIDLINLSNTHHPSEQEQEQEQDNDESNVFISSSDDKTVRFWNWQINIPTKVITDPSQHSLPNIKRHPTANYIALQSMDNSIKVIHSYGKYKWYKKKIFTGHQVAGYGIEIGFSPDGKIIMSGDTKGWAFFWDWKNGKLVRKLKIDDKPLKCIMFHPWESSKVVLGGLSGKIYYCD